MPTQFEQMIANRRKTRRGYGQRPVAGGLREQWTDPTDPSNVNGVVSGRFIQTPRSPSVDAPATSDEIQRAFYGPTVFAPGGTPAQAAAAQQRLGAASGRSPQSLLDAMRQRAGLEPATLGGPAETSPEAMRGAEALVAQSGARQHRNAFGAQYGLPPVGTNTVGLNAPTNTPMGYLQGRSNVAVPGMGPRASNQALGARRVGMGVSSTGMQTGGSFGAPLMLGQGPELKTPAPRPTIASRPMMFDSKAGRAVETTPTAFRQAMESRVGRQAPMQPTDPEKFAAYTERRQGKLADRQAAVESQGMARGKARTDRVEFRKDVQSGGLIGALTKRGIDPARAMATNALGGRDGEAAARFLSEDNRQRGVAGEAADRTQIERDRLAMEKEGQKFQQNWLDRQPKPIDAADAELQSAGESARQAFAQSHPDKDPWGPEAMNAAAQASQGRYRRYGTPIPSDVATSPPGDTRAGRFADEIEAQTGLPAWAGIGGQAATGGIVPPQVLQWLFGSERRKQQARQRQRQYATSP